MGLKPVSVSQLNSYIKRILQTDPILGNVSVVGEISNLKFHGSGHVYFSLKDNNSTIRCFLPASNVEHIPFTLEEGLEVNVYGYIYLYERGGSYSINVKDMEEAGEGKLMAEFRRLKNKLEQEGLMDQAHKRPIPTFPSKIAVVTSETGAAVRDILKIIQNKNDYVDVLIYPVIVQGPSAPAEISSAIDDLNDRFNDIDVIITGRGGGSIEELWAFNEEIVARSIYNSKIPVISAVGHEIDFTISDFVADRRAETPTAAADMAVPDTNELREYLGSVKFELDRNIKHIIQKKENALNIIDPQNTLRELKSRVTMEQMRCDNIAETMTNNINSLIADYKSRIEVAGEILKTSDPQLILSRGYALIRDDDGNILNNVDNISVGDNINIKLAEGSVQATITAKETR